MILFVDQTSALGGAELSLLDIVRQRGGHDRVLLFEPGELEQLLREDHVDVRVSKYRGSGAQVRKASGWWASLRGAAYLRHHVHATIAAAHDCELIYANTAKAFIVGALAAKWLRKPLVYHLRDILSKDHFSGFNRQLLVRLARFARATIIANSQATANAFIQAGGRAEQVTVVYNGIDEEPFELAYQQAAHHREELRRQWQIGSAPVIGVFGRFAEWKAQHIAIAAIAKLPDAHLLLVGRALFGEDAYTQRLHRLVDELGVKERVHFVGFQPNVAPLMQACDLIVHCSTAAEPFGRVIVEAMLSRVPVIASCEGGAIEILSNDRLGVLIDPGDESVLAAAIGSALKESPARLANLEYAHLEARRRFALDTQVTEINKVVERMLGKFEAKI